MVVTGVNGNWSIDFNEDSLLRRIDEILMNTSLIGHIAIYLIIMFVFTFINVVFYSELLKAINGQRVLLYEALKQQQKRLKQFFSGLYYQVLLVL